MLFPADLLAFLPALLLGALMGFFGGLFGIGGGIIAIPLLVLGYGMDQALAQGTALVMMVPNLLVGWWRYSRLYPVPLPRALGIGLCATATTWLVAQVAIGLPSALLRTVFSVFLMLLAWRLLWQLRARQRAAAQGRPDEATPRVPERYIPLVGMVGGSSMGLLGIGGGLVATPILTGVFAQRQTVAQSLSLALVAPSSIIALLSYAQAHRVDWHMGLPLAASGMLTVSAGVALAHRLPEQRMRTLFAWMLLVTGGWLLLGLLWH
ncbi:sulfite exporter TauE/SafE family protein [uncultured Aquabacterium sp.]|uniref:sulfite exporter TauE/SafE family protein n=1 Tax=Aquabacterium sp. TaxID=1872578 RepID=UPI0025F58ED7|nr:sulfite exporter TauE/SafE family protein [uncultured Aquabacterium sp.]